MIRFACTACSVKVYRFGADARACPMCRAPMVMAPRPAKEPERALGAVAPPRPSDAVT